MPSPRCLSASQAEKLNGRAAMMGYVLALFVDKLSGASLLEQQGSFLGLVALHITVFAILLVRCDATRKRPHGTCSAARANRDIGASHRLSTSAPAPPATPSHLNLTSLALTRLVARRSMNDLDQYKNLLDEATFYDKQWNATWEGVTRPSGARTCLACTSAPCVPRAQRNQREGVLRVLHTRA